MNRMFQFVRALFFLFTFLLVATHISQPLICFGVGILLFCSLVGLDILLKKFPLHSFTTTALGLLIGYLMGKTLSWIFSSIASSLLNPELFEMINTSLLLCGVYLGTMMTLRCSDEIYISIPFVRFSSSAQKKKDLVLDASVLFDMRIIDLATTGLLDHHLILPRFFVKDFHVQSEVGEDSVRNKAKRALEVIKKLEQIPGLEMRYNDTDFPELKDPASKLIRLTRLLDGMILAADFSRIQSSSLEGVRVINLHSLSHALKPLMQAGEKMKIKIQRYGKESNQGVGYLEDGTMVVVNGGGDFIGDTIDVYVLSVKHTSSGRMIFCNALDEQGCYQQAGDLDGNR